MNETETNQSMNKRQIFLLFMRYIAVVAVTILLLAFMFEMSHPYDFGPGVMLLAAAIVFFYITIPVIGFWIYSFIKSISRRTKTDKILLWFHFADLLILGIGIYFANQPPLKCDAFIMEQNCKGETGFWMRNIAHSYRRMLPDSTRLHVEFDKSEALQSDILSKQDLKELENDLEDFCGCIGIDINNYSHTGYSTILFQRIGMGMYAFRFYDRPLTPEQQDSLNDDPCLIVYNDSTVFEFMAGVLGAQTFPGKNEYVEAQNKCKDK